MTLVRFCFISSIPLLLVAGTPEAANTTMALPTDAPMQAKEIGTALTKSRHETILCCGASEESFRQITQTVSVQEFLSTNRFCFCKLIENDLTDSEGCLTEAPSWFVPWSSSADFVGGAKMLKNPCLTKSCTCNPAAPSPEPTPPREIKALGVREAMQQAWVEKTNTQSNQFAATAHVEETFVALSELTDGGTGACWLGPRGPSDLLRQHAMLLATGLNGRPPLIDLLKGSETHAGIARHGSVRQV